MHVLSEITGRPLDRITLRDLDVQCVIGVHPEEKMRPQTLKLDVMIYLDTSAAAATGILSHTVDYSLVAKQLAFILTHSRFRLLESAAEALAIFLLTPPSEDHPKIQAIELEVRKPEALGGIAEPSVRIFRSHDNRPAGLLQSPPKSILFQVPETLIERWQIPAGQTLIAETTDGLALMTESPSVSVNEKLVSAGFVMPVNESVAIGSSDQNTKSVIAVTFRGRERFQPSISRLH